jgi:hypothetical protein
MSTLKRFNGWLHPLSHVCFCAKKDLRVAALVVITVLTVGCGTEDRLTSFVKTGPSVSGSVRTGDDPVIGAEIRLFAAGEGTAKAAVPLLRKPVQSDAEGSFTLPGSYRCPSPSSQVYLVVSGGASRSAVSNSGLMMMSALGDCGELAEQAGIRVDELTTVASVFSLAPFMRSVTSLWAPLVELQSLRNAFISARALAGILEEASAARPALHSYPAAVETMLTLADGLSTCTRSAGGSIDDGTACGLLFSYAKPGHGPAPQNTADALLAIMQNPTRRVASLYSLRPAVPLFQPSSDSAPALPPVVVNVGESGIAVAPTGATSITATSQADTAQPASALVTLKAPTGTTYYLAANGSDKNSGLSSIAPWLSPKHPLKCGDTIVAAAGANYSAANFASGKWGTVTCSSGNKVAWLKCATFDACKISAPSGQFGIYVDHSYWGVQGWEVTVSKGGYTCFAAAPSQYTPRQIHHVVFANNIANGCQGGGFGTFASGSVGIDYVVLVGNIAYNAAQGTLNCYSGFSIYEPVNSDTLPGTHIYVAGNFAWGNVNPSKCAGGQPDGGTGLIFDTFDGDQTGTRPYTGQTVAANNILLANGSDGIEVQNNVTGTTHAPIYIYNNTLYGNSTAPNISTSLCADMVINSGFNIREFSNIVQTGTATACGGNDLYSSFVYQGNVTDAVAGNWFYAANGHVAGSYDSLGFSMGSNTLADPGFSSTTIPAAPGCGTFANVPACMAPIISSFTPLPQAAAYGYQRPVATIVSDPYFPSWLCSASLPSGLVTTGCSKTQ